MKDELNDALFNADNLGGGKYPPCTGVKSDALPEIQSPPVVKDSETGVSTRNALNDTKHWFAVRTTYGRELKAYDHIVSNGGIAFLPLIKQKRVVNGKEKIIEVCRIPNIFFIYGTEAEAKIFVYDNVHLPFLRFYYESCRIGSTKTKRPLIVPDNQMRSLMILCAAEAEDIRLVPEEMVKKFREGDSVIITEGEFKGVEGKVARWHRQQRVAVIIDGLCVMATAYVPSAYLKKIDSKP